METVQEEKKVRVCVVPGVPVNTELLAQEFELVDPNKEEVKMSEIDYLICWARPPMGVGESDLNKVIILEGEPPIYTWPVYDSFPKFHTVFTFNPKGSNEFPFSDFPLVYPYNSYFENPVVRKDTNIKNRKVYFAGLKSDKMDEIKRHNCKIVYGLRSRIADHFLRNGNGIIFGKNWPQNTKETPIGWQDQKFVDLDEHDPDFILCMENSVVPNYISEKILDGFSSDRLVFYFGCPNILDFVPEDCFIYLNNFYDEATDTFDFERLDNLINNMTQEEYDGYIERARTFRETLKGKHQEEKDKLTKFIIGRLENV